MPTEQIALRKVREILRLTYDNGLPSREEPAAHQSVHQRLTARLETDTQSMSTG